MREFLREVNVGLPVSRLAKWKTGFQMTALSMMLLKGFWCWGGIGEVLLWIAGVLTFITGYQYFQKSLDYICETEKCAKIPPMPKIISDLKIPVAAKKEKVQPKESKKAVAAKVKAKKSTEVKNKAKAKPKTKAKVK